MTEKLSNWAGNHTYSAARVNTPQTVEEIQALVKQARKVKVLGTRHSFNDIADTTEDLISLANLAHVVAIDHEHHTVTIEAGMRYGELCQHLNEAGYALHNLASLPHISVAGACATATHGSGDKNGNLATIVAGLELVKGDGDIVVLSREQHGEQFAGAAVGLGGLGVITKLTLDIMPAFAVRQDVYQNLALAELEKHFDDITSSAYSVSFFTNWQQGINQVWLKRLVTAGAPFEAAPELFGATLAQQQLHPLPGLPVENCTPQLGIPGPWYDRLPHFRLEFTPSNGEELQSEYLVPRQQAYAALSAVAGLRDKLAPVLQISEIRTIAADNLWMSTAYQQDSVGVHFTWKKDWQAVKQVLPLIEAELVPLGGRPHWGKLFTVAPAAVGALYPKLHDFQDLLRSYDPEGKFRNAFLDTYIMGTQ